jgi:hypothetical protein
MSITASAYVRQAHDAEMDRAAGVTSTVTGDA